MPPWYPEHQYRASTPAPENDRTMIFYNDARVDGLQKRIETPTEMTEHFVNREDFLYYRRVEFKKREKIFGPAKSDNPRPIVVCDNLFWVMIFFVIHGSVVCIITVN